MKGILFVDDEPLILEALKRWLSPMNREWHMRFACCGAEALEQLEEEPADVVVSDMRMPQMSGAELLNEVKRRHPKTVRLILSGFADMEMILQCIEGTHQFLAKPCSSETLKNVVGRALAMDAWVNNGEIKALVSRLRTLPILPSLYFEILRELETPQADLEKIGAKIAQDPGMTAKLLQLVNSAFFGLRRQFVDPTDAVMQLGLETINALVMGIHIFSQIETDGEAERVIQKLWRHSVGTAKAAHQIARVERPEKSAAAEAFTAGLLHDIGRLVLVANLPEQYSEALRISRIAGLPLLEAETEVFGASHTGVGGYLLGLWGLPISLVEAAVFHHFPGKCAHKEFGALSLVHAANVFSHELEDDSASGLPQLDSDYLKEIGVWDRVPTWRSRPGEYLVTKRAA